MFRKVTALSFLLVFCMGAAVSLSCVRMRKGDVGRYRKLVKESVELRSKRALERHPAHQLRHGVQKDIWTPKANERSHFRLRSEGSELIIQQKKDKFEATESLQNLECCVQEEIDLANQTQQVRFVTAELGTYFFPNHQFLANEVSILFYDLPGAELPQVMPDAHPFLKGHAKEASFSAGGKTANFTAYELQAQFDPLQRSR